MRSVLEYIYEAQMKADKWKSYKLWKIKSEFKRLGYLNYGFIHFFDYRDIKLDYPGLDKSGDDIHYEYSDIKYCPKSLYYKAGESPYLRAIDIARSTGSNESYATFDNDNYGVFFNKELKYFYTVKLTNKNVKMMDKLHYVKDRTEDLKSDFDKMEAERKKREMEEKKKAVENKKNKADFEKFAKLVDKAKADGEKLFDLYQEDPSKFEKAGREVMDKIHDSENKMKKITVDGRIEKMNPRDLYPSYDVRLTDDDPYGRSNWIRLIEVDGKKYYYEFEASSYPSDYYWGD